MKRVGIIAAMEEEITALKNKATISEEVEIGKSKFYLGQINDKEVVMVMCGIGKVNGAMAAQLLINNFNVGCVINTGVAGAISDILNMGDIVISEYTLQHDFDVTSLGYKKGQIPRMEEYIFKADKSLIELAHGASEELDAGVFVGGILSGDQFIDSKDTKLNLLATFDNAYCVEMEGAAIGQVCYLYGVPYIVIRSISDGADDDAKISFNKFLEIACKNSTVLVDKIIQKM